MCKEALGWWRAARSVALPFAVDRAEGDSTQIGKSPTRVIRSAVAAAALQPERHEHMPFDRLRITGAHHPDRADRQRRSRPVRRHVSPARRWLGDSWLRPEAAHPQRLQLEEYRSIERAPAIRASPNWPNAHPPWRSWCIFAGRPRGSRCSRTPIRSRRTESPWRTTGPSRHDRCWTNSSAAGTAAPSCPAGATRTRVADCGDMGRSERRSRGGLLVLLIVVLVNEDATQISFLGLDFTMPIGVAKLFLGGRRRACHCTDRWRANPSDPADIR